jgi:hypothetical protein
VFGILTAKRRGLRLVQAWLIPPAQVALAEAQRLSGDTQADVVNRAIQYYAQHLSQTGKRRTVSTAALPDQPRRRRS